MYLSNNSVAFNYQSEINIADSIFDTDKAAGESYFKKVSAKNKSLTQIKKALNSLRYDLLETSLVQAAVGTSQGKALVESLFFSFINAFNSVQRTDQRNHASYVYFQKLKESTDTFNEPVDNIQDYKIAGFKDPTEVDKLVNLTDIVSKIGLISESSPVLATAFISMHPTHQQVLARAFRNAMLEISARHHIYGESIDPELLKIAIYAASCGKDIAFPYI